jgi:hypothetical protein
MEFSSFPKNLAYNIKTLAGFSKTTVKLSPDKNGTINNGDTVKVKLPSNTIVDLRTFSMYFKGVASATSGKVHFPRLSSSIIKTLAVYVNGTLIERIDNYNILYNKLYDLDGGGIDQTTKRFLENADPSVNYEYVATSELNTGGTPLSNTLLTTSSDSKKMMVNNWLGFLSTCNCPCPDTNDLNNVEIEITFDSEKILWSSAAGTANADPVVTGAKYEVQDLSFTISKIVFNDPLYYNLKAAKLLSSGLTIGYQTYITSKMASFTKGTSVNVLTTVNSTSLDQLICCLQPANIVIAPLQLATANATTTAKTFNEVFATGGGGQLTASTLALQPHTVGDLYNQSYYFRSNATGLTYSSIEINNTPLMPQPLDDVQIYNENLIALGNLNQDMSSGIHPGCNSLAAFLKYYFAHIVSLENLQQGDFYKSGLDGRASALNVAWKVQFTGTSVETFTPYIFAKTTRIMVVNEGHSITVVV